MDKRVYLKVKIKSLAEEAKIIRKEERKCSDQDLRNGLTNHRKLNVRREARATLLAYGFLNGREIKDVEPNHNRTSAVIWEDILNRSKSMVKRYGGNDQDFGKWAKLD